MRPVIGVAAAAVVLAAAAGASRSWSHHHQAAAATVPTATAGIVRTDLVTTTQAAGTLGYAGAYQVVEQTPGSAITGLPQPGTRLDRGSTAFEIDGRAIPLFFGARPMWRTLQTGVTPGADVVQLDENLRALGFSDGGRLGVDEHFTWRTRAAIEQWQVARGAAVTGTVQVGDVVYAPGPLRVASLEATVGAVPQPGSVAYDATSPVPAVQLALPVTQEYLVHPGDDVTVTLPDGRTTTPGMVIGISSSATAATGASSGPSGGNASSSNSPSSDSNEPATVNVTIALRNPGAGANYSQAPVTANIVNARERGVLAVPINALVALSDGGYGLDLVQGTQPRLVAVQPGLFAGTLVQVSGSGLAPGMRVEVPAS